MTKNEALEAIIKHRQRWEARVRELLLKVAANPDSEEVRQELYHADQSVAFCRGMWTRVNIELPDEESRQ